MQELFRTNDPVLLSWAEALLAGEGIATFILDSHMSVMEGSANAIPRRMMVEDADFPSAKALITAARAELGLSADIRWGENSRGDGSP